MLANLGMQMQTVAVGWEIYERTGSAMSLGWVGMVQFLPVIALALPAGYVADHFDRRLISMACLSFIASSSLGLAGVSYGQLDIRLMYGFLLMTGIARAFLQPTKASILPQIVAREQFSNAVTWNSGGFHLASVLGPALGGLLIAIFQYAYLVYLLDAITSVAFIMMLAPIRLAPVFQIDRSITLRSLMAGISFLGNSPLILAAITLDLFAVLLGGATTLLPIYAKDILQVGPTGLGWLRAAPAMGALIMALSLAHRPPMKKAGYTLLYAVAGFGLATIVFGVSRSFILSLVMLFLTGTLDNISVVIRHTLVQLLTPNEMRGRVSAINSMFIGASNELGGFESGLVAALFSPTISVVSGGIGTIMVVVVIAVAWPQLRCYGQLGTEPPSVEDDP